MNIQESLMIKQISMMKRHPALTMEEFIARYESYHAKFGEVLFAKAARYVRRYVEPMRNPLTDEIMELDFDIIMEIWWKSSADFEQAMRELPKSNLLNAIKESGAALFASHENPSFTVREYESDLKG
jgi:hypothetical protein